MKASNQLAIVYVMNNIHCYKVKRGSTAPKIKQMNEFQVEEKHWETKEVIAMIYTTVFNML